MQKQPTNPETERHQQLLTKDRQRTRQEGISLLILGTIITVLEIPMTIPMLPSNKANLINQIIPLSLLLLGPAFLLAGVTAYREGKRPPSEQEIRESRQRERTELFRTAQGKLPWLYSKTTRIIITVIAPLFIIGGTELTLTNHLEIMIYGILSIIGGLLLLYIAHIMLPRIKRDLPETSAKALESSLITGEMTEGPKPPQE